MLDCWGGGGWSKVWDGQAFLKMGVAALRLRQGCGATGRGRAHSAKGRFRGVSILVEAISCVCETTMNGRMTHGGDHVQRNPIESKLIRPWGFKKIILTTDCEPQWQTRMNTDGEKTLTRIARIFAKGAGAGWGACRTATGHNSRAIMAARLKAEF